MRYVLGIFMIFCLFTSAFAVESENIKKVMKLYKSHQYDDATQLLFNSVANPNTLSSVELLQSSLVLIKNLKIHKVIHQKTINAQQIYLQILVNDKNKRKSLYAPLYLAEILILKGQLKQAKNLLNNFSSQNNISVEYLDQGKILLAWIAALQNDNLLFKQLTQEIDKNNPLSIMAVNALKMRFKKVSSLNPETIRQAEPLYKVNNQIISAKFANLALRIYTDLGQFDKAIDIHLRFSKSTVSLVEQINEDKVIRFYEVSLSENLYRFYYALAKNLLNRVVKDKKYHDMAVYYLSELELLVANKNTAEKYMTLMNGINRLPKKLAELTEIRANAHGYLAGHQNRAFQAWEEAVNNLKNNPFLSADAILMCIYVDANCPTIAQIAQLSAEAGRSERFEGLSLNVGRYFLINNHTAKARRLLENALDKSNSHSLSANDPMLLINLADVYRIDKNYAESLQVYFTVAQNFPVMRQIQDAVQGEYLFEQRSSGIPVVH